MPLQLYTDHHVPRPVVRGVRIRGIDVLTAEEDGAERTEDSVLMHRATSLNRVLVSMDEDLLAEAARRLEGCVRFSGLIYAHQLRIQVGRFVNDLVSLCEIREPHAMENQVIHLPLR